MIDRRGGWKILPVGEDQVAFAGVLKVMEIENEFIMSQDGYASIDFTLLDRPNNKYVPVLMNLSFEVLSTGEIWVDYYDFHRVPGFVTLGRVFSFGSLSLAAN